jgi:hypothetical protein
MAAGYPEGAAGRGCAGKTTIMPTLDNGRRNWTGGKPRALPQDAKPARLAAFDLRNLGKIRNAGNGC